MLSPQHKIDCDSRFHVRLTSVPTSGTVMFPNLNVRKHYIVINITNILTFSYPYCPSLKFYYHFTLYILQPIYGYFLAYVTVQIIYTITFLYFHLHWYNIAYVFIYQCGTIKCTKLHKGDFTIHAQTYIHTYIISKRYVIYYYTTIRLSKSFANTHCN